MSVHNPISSIRLIRLELAYGAIEKTIAYHSKPKKNRTSKPNYTGSYKKVSTHSKANLGYQQNELFKVHVF